MYHPRILSFRTFLPTDSMLDLLSCKNVDDFLSSYPHFVIRKYEKNLNSDLNKIKREFNGARRKKQNVIVFNSTGRHTISCREILIGTIRSYLAAKRADIILNSVLEVWQEGVTKEHGKRVLDFWKYFLPISCGCSYDEKTLTLYMRFNLDYMNRVFISFILWCIRHAELLDSLKTPKIQGNHMDVFREISHNIIKLKIENGANPKFHTSFYSYLISICSYTGSAVDSLDCNGPVSYVSLHSKVEDIYMYIKEIYKDLSASDILYIKSTKKGVTDYITNLHYMFRLNELEEGSK